MLQYLIGYFLICGVGLNCFLLVKLFRLLMTFVKLKLMKKNFPKIQKVTAPTRSLSRVETEPTDPNPSTLPPSSVEALNNIMSEYMRMLGGVDDCQEQESTGQ